MLQRSLAALSVAALLVTGASAQQSPSPVQKQPETTTPAAPAPRAPAQLVNVRLDLMITDQRDGSAGAPTTVSLLVADRESARIRSGGGRDEMILNVDARPEIVRDGRARVYVSLEYRPARVANEKEAVGMLSKSLSTILDDGKQLLVSQTMDPSSHRTVKVELKATILK